MKVEWQARVDYQMASLATHYASNIYDSVIDVRAKRSTLVTYDPQVASRSKRVASPD